MASKPPSSAAGDQRTQSAFSWAKKVLLTCDSLYHCLAANTEKPKTTKITPEELHIQRNLSKIRLFINPSSFLSAE